MKEGYYSWRAGKTWYKITGDLNSGILPLIVINGGPGSSSDYCKPFDDLQEFLPVIRYDQLDTGKSDHPNNPVNWTFESYLEELMALLEHLKIEKFHLLGHSWGAMLALEYMRYDESAKPESLILAACMWDIPAYNKIAQTLLKEISPIAAIRTKQLEDAGKVNSAEYKALNQDWSDKHIYRGGEYPKWAQSPNGLNLAPYNYMWGPSEFTVNGTMKNWSARDWMPNIKIPTLVISGEYDEATPEHSQEAGKILPNATVRIVKDASHLAHIEQPKEYLGFIREFIGR